MEALPPSTSYQPRALRAFNRVARQTQRVGLFRFDLSRASLEQAARKATGLDDFGEPDYVAQFDALLDSVEREADLNPFGRFILRMDLIRILKARLHAEALWKRHPEILEAPIEDPIVIAGLPRTGTTLLQRLLGRDPDLQVLTSWESLYPVPFPEHFKARDKGERDPRIRETEMNIRAMDYLCPQLQQVHPLIAEEPEEELGLLVHAFASMLHEVIRQLPSFSAFIEREDQTFAYRYMVKLLQTVQWFRGSAGRRWVLKSPQHVQDLDCLLRVFPRASVICTHRDPVKLVTSTCSLAWCASVRDNDELDPNSLGREWQEKLEGYARRALATRAEHDPSHFIDLLYADIVASPHATIERLYAQLERKLDDEARSAMSGWLAENRQGKHGRHQYAPEHFGLDADSIRTQYRFYSERFGVPDEA